MKPLPIGIVGGAGPMAGCALLERLFRLSIEKYGCFQDADFPKAILLSFPFSDMLTADVKEEEVRQELKACLNQLRNNGAEVLAIACNTLHAFLAGDEEDLVHMPKSVAEALDELPLVLCTSTSRRFGLHKRSFPCVYPEDEMQDHVDRIIKMTLQGFDMAGELIDLLKVDGRTCVLGCTELSLYYDKLQSCPQAILDPLNIVANKILEKSFRR